MVQFRGDRVLEQIIRPIMARMDHPQVTDIVVNKPRQVGIRKNGMWEWLDVPSFDFDTLDAATILMGQRTGREFDESHPYVNSTTPEGWRFQGIRPPGTQASRLLWAIRRPPTTARKLDDPDFDELTSEVNDMATRQVRAVGNIATAYKNKEWRSFFRDARLSGMSIGFVGAMGDGKSDMVRRCAQVYRHDIRMVTVETDDEMGEAGPDNKAPLLYDDARMSADEAIRIAKRLAAQEAIFQEVRGPEAWSMLLLMNSGVNGLTTWHANEGHEHEALCDMARSHPASSVMSDARLMEKAMGAFDVVAYCRRNDQGRFRISSVRLMFEETKQ